MKKRVSCNREIEIKGNCILWYFNGFWTGTQEFLSFEEALEAYDAEFSYSEKEWYGTILQRI